MTTKWMPLMGTGLAVRFEILDEEQAMRNHGQTLDRLAARGGLSPDEALSIARRKNYERKAAAGALLDMAFMRPNAGGQVTPIGAPAPTGSTTP